MSSTSGYLAKRLALGIIVLLIVLFIMSAIVSYGRYSRGRVDVRNHVYDDVYSNEDKIQNMSYEEKQEWLEKKKQEYRKKIWTFLYGLRVVIEQYT